jgi:hypothetical protein
MGAGKTRFLRPLNALNSLDSNRADESIATDEIEFNFEIDGLFLARDTTDG